MKIKSNYEELKKEERAYCSNFFQKYYKQEPKYIPINIKRPDCYYEVSDKKYIVEMTTYFIQEEEQQIYRLKNNDIVLGYRLLEQVTEPFGTRRTDKFIYKKHLNELEYSRLDDGHMIKNLYSEEITFLKVFI